MTTKTSRTGLISQLSRLGLQPLFGSVNTTIMTKSNRTELSLDPDLLLISNALVVISGKWRLYIILVLGEQTLRYGQLSDRLPGVSEKVLASELKALVALGVIKREAYAEIPPRVEYTLTERGRLALPILRQVQQIGQIFN